MALQSAGRSPVLNIAFTHYCLETIKIYLNAKTQVSSLKNDWVMAILVNAH